MPVSKKKKYPKEDFTHTKGYKKRHPEKPVSKDIPHTPKYEIPRKGKKQ